MGLIRFILRFVGFVLLVAAFVALIYDGTKTLAGTTVMITPVDVTWTNVHPSSLEAAQAKLKANLPASALELVNAYFFKAPASLLLGILGALLLLLGRKPKPLIGYARE